MHSSNSVRSPESDDEIFISRPAQRQVATTDGTERTVQAARAQSSNGRNFKIAAFRGSCRQVGCLFAEAATGARVNRPLLLHPVYAGCSGRAQTAANNDDSEYSDENEDDTDSEAEKRVQQGAKGRGQKRTRRGPQLVFDLRVHSFTDP